MKTENSDVIVAEITAFADEAHGDQMRKYVPKRYIVHPIEVMEICREYTQELPVLAAALLHDVLEDTPVTEQEIALFLQPLMSEAEVAETLKLVVDLTDVYIKEAYPNLNRRQRKERENQRLADAHPKAQTIKYADIISNGIDITKHDRHFARVYLREMGLLLSVMTAGDAQLYQRALDTVAECRQQMVKK